MTRIGHHHGWIACLAVVVTATATLAGPLNPPAGPVASTGKTLTEVEPRIAISKANTPGDADSVFKITQPGSYYLPENIIGVAGRHGIEIVSSGVTLDLNGFDLAGVPGSLDGVTTTVSDLVNIVVRNGSVRGWGSEGVNLSSAGSVVSDISASLNGFIGIQVLGAGGIISRCAAFSNVIGIATGPGCTIAGCTVSFSTGVGISAGEGNTILGCTVYANGGVGINAWTSSTVSGCTSRGNGLDGIRCTAHCLIISNLCSANGAAGDGAGIRVTNNDNRIEGNNCLANDRGLDVDSSGNFIARNTCSGNTTNWDVVAGNVILVVAGTPAPAVLGNSGGAAPGSTDPNANFTY